MNKRNIELIFLLIIIIPFLNLILETCYVKQPIGPFMEEVIITEENNNNIVYTNGTSATNGTGSTNGTGATNGGGETNGGTPITNLYTVIHDWEIDEESWTSNWGNAVRAIDVQQSILRATNGSGSLSIYVTLDAGHVEGEVTYLINPSTLNLFLKKVHLWFFFPAGAEGDPISPNGIQIIFIDHFWKSMYSKWTNIGPTGIIENQWYPIVIDTASEPWDWDEGADFSQLYGYGIRINRGPASTYSGSFTFYVDAFGWE